MASVASPSSRPTSGIARNILSDRLQRLVDHGVLEQVPYQQRPLRHEYRLTAKGADLSPSLVALMHWGDHWYAEDRPPTVLVHDDVRDTARAGHPLPVAATLDVTPTHIASRPGPGVAEPTPSMH